MSDNKNKDFQTELKDFLRLGIKLVQKFVDTGENDTTISKENNSQSSGSVIETQANQQKYEFVKTRQKDNLEILKYLEKIILQFPDLRFGQILYIVHILNNDSDIFYVEPSEMVKKLQAFCKDKNII